MDIAFLSIWQTATGNATTAERLRSQLMAIGHTVRRVDVLTTPRLSEPFDLAIGLHAYRSGRLLIDQRSPYILIFGGTDLNSDVSEPAKLSVMTQAVSQARGLVGLNPAMIKIARQLWPDVSARLQLIRQGISVAPSQFSLKRTIGLDSADHMFLLPSGFRSVKDPLFLAETFRQWHCENPRIHLVIIGSERDSRTVDLARERGSIESGIVLCEPVPADDLHAAMREAAAVLNTSLSESSPNAILEAMALGTPVLVRDNDGCLDHVEHQRTGLVFRDPDEFRSLAEALLASAEMRAGLVSRALQSVARWHANDVEQQAYADLIDWAIRPG